MFAAARSCANVRQDGSSGKSVSGSFAHEETDTARTHLTKHGPLGCRAGLALARGRFCRCCCCQTTVVLFSRARRFSRQRSDPCRVRRVRAVSVLHGRRRRNLRHPNSNGSRPRTAVHEPSVRHLERGIAGRVAPTPPTPPRCAARLRPPHSPDRCLTPTPWPRARRARASRPRPRRRLRPSPY